MNSDAVRARGSRKHDVPPLGFSQIVSMMFEGLKHLDRLGISAEGPCFETRIISDCQFYEHYPPHKETFEDNHVMICEKSCLHVDII